MLRSSRIVLLAGAGSLVAGSLVSYAAAGPAGPSFTSPVQLKGAVGGEPSIAADPAGDVVVTGPQGIPSGVNGTPGVGVWVSHTDGASFATAALHGSYLGGGDSDVVYATPAASRPATFYIADLEAAAAAVCKSTDRGKTWSSIGPVPDPGNCGGVVVGQAGPSNDREWLTPDRQGHLYLTYHEFVSAQPVVFRDDNGGGDLFADGPCGPIVTDPSIEANVPTDITGGTLVSKPVTDAAGNLYIMFTTTTQEENVAGLADGQVSGSFSQVYLAVSHDHCGSFTDYTVYDGSKLGTNSVQFGDIFNALAIDGAGNLYAVAAGYVGKTPYATTANAYLLSSTDHGKTWTSPRKVSDTPREADMLPAAVGGPRAGELAIGFFRTVNNVTNPNDTKADWTYEVGVSTNATTPAPAFAYAPVSGSEQQPTVYHHGDVCNEGILCGTTPNGPSDRSLLDFTSATLDPAGCPLYTFAGNPTGSPGHNDFTNTFNYVARQTTDCFPAPAPAPVSPLRAVGVRSSR